MDNHRVDEGSRAVRCANKLWYGLDEAAQQLDQQPCSILQRLVPMAYHPEPRRGQIRFRVMGGTQGLMKLWWEDVVALKKGFGVPVK